VHLHIGGNFAFLVLTDRDDIGGILELKGDVFQLRGALRETGLIIHS
jgi:hypothetical protein